MQLDFARMKGPTGIAIKTLNPLSTDQVEILLRTTPQESPLYGEFLRARIGQLFLLSTSFILEWYLHWATGQEGASRPLPRL